MRRGVIAFALVATLGGCGKDEITVRVPSESMLPTFAEGTELKVDQAAYDEARPMRGEVVVLRAPSGFQDIRCGVTRSGREPCPRPTPPGRTRVLQRVIALPGDRVSFDRGRAVVNGRRERRRIRVGDPNCEFCTLTEAIRVPRGHYFTAVENRDAGIDCRFVGPSPLRSFGGRFAD